MFAANVMKAFVSRIWYAIQKNIIKVMESTTVVYVRNFSQPKQRELVIFVVFAMLSWIIPSNWKTTWLLTTDSKHCDVLSTISVLLKFVVYMVTTQISMTGNLNFPTL